VGKKIIVILGIVMEKESVVVRRAMVGGMYCVCVCVLFLIRDFWLLFGVWVVAVLVCVWREGGREGMVCLGS
jgi:hypothetical protein